MNAKRNSIAPFFSVKKKFSWKDRVIRFLELGLIALVILGTLFWLLISSHFSFNKFLSGVVNNIQPKISSSSAQKVTSDEDKIKQLLKTNNVIQVVSVTKSQEGYLEVHSKEGLIVYFSLAKNLQDEVTTLQTLSSKAKIDNKSLKIVDFRFNKIVVQYN